MGWKNLKTRKKHSGAFSDLSITQKVAIRNEIKSFIFSEEPKMYVKSGLMDSDDIWRYSSGLQEKLKKRLAFTEDLWLPEKNYYVDGELFFQFFEQQAVRDFTVFVLNGHLFKSGDWLFQLSYLDVIERYCSFYPVAFYEELLKRYPKIAKIFIFTERANYFKACNERYNDGLKELVTFFNSNYKKLGFNNLYDAVKAYNKAFPKYFKGSNRQIFWSELAIDFDFVDDWSLKGTVDIENLNFIERDNKLKTFTINISEMYIFLENKILKIRVVDNFVEFCKLIFSINPELSRGIPFVEVDKAGLSVLKENTFSLSVRLKEEMTDEVFYNHCNDLIVYFIYFVKSPLYKGTWQSLNALKDTYNYLNSKELHKEITENIKDIPVIEGDEDVFDEDFKI